MDRFSKAHPILHFAFFICVFVLCVSVYNPVFSVIALLCALLYDVRLNGKKAFSSLKLVLAITVIVSFFNMVFTHYGEDVLFKLNDVQYTLESLFYGFNQGLVLSAMLIWFSIFSRITDSQRVMYLLRFAPKTAMIFTMVLGFISRFTRKLEDIRDAQLGLNGGKEDYTIQQRLKQGVSNLSALVTYSLESSIDTSDSMQARGYNPKAIRASRYKLKPVYALLTVFVFITVWVIIAEKANGNMVFVFEPKIYFEHFSVASAVLFLNLCLLPNLLDLTEDVIWKISALKK